MAQLKKYNLDGNCVGEVEFPEDFSTSQVNTKMVKDYVHAIRRNMRQWSANTKDRSEVNHSNAKPHPQKGTGRARQGTLATPQYKGGGVVFGPKPKFNQHVRINKKERQAVIQHILADKAVSETLIVVEDPEMNEPKTKTVANFLKQANIAGRCLFVLEGNYEEEKNEAKVAKRSTKSSKYLNFKRSVSNVPKSYTSLVNDLNGYQLLSTKYVVMSQSALSELLAKGGTNE